jgi:hypothetical protein
MGMPDVAGDAADDAAESDGSTRDRFAAEVLDAVLVLDSAAEARYVPEHFWIDYRHSGSQARTRIYLSNVFAECQGASVQERRARIAKVASIVALAEVPETWDAIRPLLRPVLRQATFAAGAGRVRVPMFRPAMPYLAEMVVIDTPTAMRYVTAHQVEQWGVSADEVFAAARENLASRAPSGADGDEPPRPVMTRFADTGGDGYFASLPLLPGWLAGFERRVGGRPVAVVPDHAGLLVLGESDPAGPIAPLAELALAEYRNAVRSISPVLYVADADGAVVPYTVPRDDPAWRILREAEVTLAVDVYSQQTTLLRAEYERDAVDVYVASLIRVCSETDGTYITFAAWADGIRSDLPQAHYVALGADREMFLTPFEVVVEELGLAPIPDVYPPRYRVGPWPDAQVMARLRARAEKPYPEQP